MERPEEKKAHELMTKAEAALNKWSWFSSSSKYDDAGELYAKAANNFKVAKNWEMAGQCFVKCAEMNTKTGNQFEAASNLVLAAGMAQRVDPGVAVGHYREAISLLSELGRFSTAAKHCEAVGEMYEKDNNLKEAIQYFQQAADYYSGDNMPARAVKSTEKVALHSATLEQYDVARAGFEKLGTDALDSNILKFNAKKYFLHAGFCSLARGDLVAARNGVSRYSELDFTFRDSAECKLLDNLIDACTEMDVDRFADVLFAFDAVRRLDPWETSILIRVKNQLGASANDEDDLK